MNSKNFYQNISINFIGLFLILLCFASNSFADKFTYFYSSCSSNFIRGYFLAELENTSKLFLIPANKIKYGSEVDNSIDIYAAKISSKFFEKSNLNYSLVCVDSEDRIKVLPTNAIMIKDNYVFFDDSTNLSQDLIDKKQILSTLREQLYKASDQVKIFKEDIRSISGLDRVALLTDELNDHDKKLVQIQNFIDNSKKNLEAMQQEIVPSDLLIKERNIKAALNKLSQNYLIENSKNIPAANSENSNEEYLQFAKDYDLEALENQLNLVRMERIRIEEQVFHLGNIN